MRITRESLQQENQALQLKIDSLKKELKKQRENSFLLMMEAVRARRWAEAEHYSAEQARHDCEEALRKVSNIKKWMEYKGIYGYRDPQATDEMREDFRYEQRNL